MAEAIGNLEETAGGNEPQVMPDVENITPMVTERVPMKEQIIYDAGGNPKRRTMVPDKNAPFLLPAPRLRAEAYAVILKPVSQQVLLQDKKGNIVARFTGREQARLYLKTARVDTAKLKNNVVLEPDKPAKGRA